MKCISKVLMALSMIISPHLAFSRETITLSAPKEFAAHINEIIVKEAYDRIGYDIQVLNVPPRRALEMSNEGEVDGELFRVPIIMNYAKNLRMIPTPINELRVRAFSNHVVAKMESWDSLKPYKIGIVRGHKFSDLGTIGMNRVVAKNVNLLFEMLEVGRVDIVIVTEYSGLEAKRRLGIEDIYALDGTIQVVPVYHFVYKDNARLIPALDNAIKNMKAESQPQYDPHDELINYMSISSNSNR